MSTLEEKIMHTLESTNQRLSLLLWGRREMKIEGVVGPCKGCGWPHATVSYTYVEESATESVTERVCHDCAWPKKKEYLREKEEKRQKEQAKKEKREYAEKWLEHHQTEAEQGHECNQCEEERAEFWGGDYVCNCGAVKPPCRACTHPGNPIAQEAGCQ